jgi:ELWxxDGT repeat protein
LFRAALPVTAAGLAMAAGAIADIPRDINQPVVRVADTLAGPGSGMSTISTFVGVEGRAVFRASSGVSTVNRLWSSTGRVGGTSSIAGTDGVATDPVRLPGTGKVLAYTGVGTLRPLISVDARTGVVEALSPTAMNASTTGLIFAGSSVIFMAPVGGINTMWASDGTASGTAPVIDPAAGTIGNVTPVNGAVYFTTRSASNVYTLWRTDGTVMNPTRVTDLRGAPTWNVSSSGMRAIGERVLFSQTSATAGMSEVWVSDGTHNGTTMVATTPTVTSVLAFPNDGAGLFSTRLQTNGLEFWRMSSVASECRSMMNFARVTTFNAFGTYGSMTLFGDQGGGSQYNTNQMNAVTIWITDGTPENTLGIPGFPGAPATGSFTATTGAQPFVMAGDTLFVDSAVGGAGHEPWRMNLTTGQLGQLRDIIPGGGSSNPTKFFALDAGRGAGFFAFDTGQHSALFTSDGTTGGTRIASRMGGVSVQYAPKSVGSRVFFVSTATTNGYEPYAVDLCPADYDNSGAVSVDDLFGFISDWFSGNLNTDTDNSGAPDMNDLMGYFNTWMGGCPA